jgi:hypothetical protein
MLESRTNDIPQPCDEERILAAHFTGKKEVHEAILQMERNKAPGWDGFQQNFTKKFGM